MRFVFFHCPFDNSEESSPALRILRGPELPAYVGGTQILGAYTFEPACQIPEPSLQRHRVTQNVCTIDRVQCEWVRRRTCFCSCAYSSNNSRDSSTEEVRTYYDDPNDRELPSTISDRRDQRVGVDTRPGAWRAMSAKSTIWLFLFCLMEASSRIQSTNRVGRSQLRGNPMNEPSDCDIPRPCQSGNGDAVDVWVIRAPG